MVATETERYEMHRELRNRLGEHVADMLMEHLPPSGWSDVARTSDIDLVIAEVGFVKRDLEHLRAETNIRFSTLEKRLDSLVHGVWAAVGIFSAAFIALFSLIAARG